MTDKAIEAAARAIQDRYWKGDLQISISDARIVCTEFAKAAIEAYKSAMWIDPEEYKGTEADMLILEDGRLSIAQRWHFDEDQEPYWSGRDGTVYPDKVRPLPTPPKE